MRSLEAISISLLQVLTNNALSGPLPASFGSVAHGSFQSLRTLNLNKNKLTGALPPGALICTNKSHNQEI